MKQNERIDWIMLGILCLMPSLFFWVINGLPIDLHMQSIPIFGGVTKLEYLICAYVFPLISVGLGWNAYRHCEKRKESYLIIGVSILELIVALIVSLIR